MDGGSLSTVILLLRHAESEWNAEGRWQGRADPVLSSRGRAAAVRAGTLLPAFPTVVASNLTRARETARLIAGGDSGCADLAWVTPLLAERSVGAWEGLTRDEIELHWPGYLARQERPPGYESDESALRRLQTALEVLGRDFRGSRVLCVTHGGLIYALEAWAGLPRTRLANLAGRWVTLQDGVVALGARDGRALATSVSEG
ncbi:MAG: histidine phosphatase family protein [Actinomycetota bacterium]|nr:histidine phosphatase family protein [Actinomycetota bacterium]